MKRLHLVVLSLVLLLAACGPEEVVDLGPTATPDPLAFYAPTLVSPGQPENPLQILYVPPNPESPRVASSQQSTSQLISDRAGLAAEVVVVGSYAEALDILCDNTDGARFTAAWLNGPSAVLAEARGCGERVLKATFDGQDGFVGEILGVGGGSIGSLNSGNFCRTSQGPLFDFYSWTLPVLALQANRIDITQLADVVDVPSLQLAAESTQDGTCRAMAAPQGLVAAETDVSLVPFYSSPAVPIGLLFIPPELLLADREALIDAYLEIGGYVSPEDAEGGGETANDAGTDATSTYFEVDIDTLDLPDERKALLWLSGGDGVAPIEADDLNETRELMLAAGFPVETESTE